MLSIKTLLNKVVDVSKYIAGISGIVAVLWGGFKFIDKINTQTDAIYTVEQKLTTIQDSVSSLSRQMNDMNLQMEGIHENTVLIGNYVEGVDKAFQYHLKQSAEVSKEDFAKMMELITATLQQQKAVSMVAIEDPKIVVRKLEK